MGGWGVSPDFRMIPMTGARSDVSISKMDGMIAGSSSHGFEPLTTVVRRFRSLTECPSGPKTAGTPVFMPVQLLAAYPSMGKIPNDGLNPYRPQAAAGILMDPPTSVPIPRALPRKANKLPSPPLLPPGVKCETTGFLVLPNRLLCASATSMVCGVFVLACSGASAFLNAHRLLASSS